MSFLHWGPQSWMRHSSWSLPEQSRRTESLPLPCRPYCFLMQPRMGLAFWAASALCQLVFCFLSTSNPQSVYPGLLSIHSLHSLYLGLELPDPGGGPWTCPCWTLWGSHKWTLKPVKVLLDDIPSLQRVNCTKQLGVISKLAEGAWNPTAHVNNKNVESANINPRGGRKKIPLL